MAPIKFEENIKDKLEKRTLSPSSDGWSKLADRLDEDEKESKKPMYWWLSIAAGLLVMMAVSIQFFNNSDSENILPQVVEDSKVEEVLEIKTQEKINNTEIELANETQLEDRKTETPMVKTPQIIDYKKTVKSQTKKQTKLAEQNDLKESKNLSNNNNDNKLINKEQQNIIDNAQMREALAMAMQDLKTEKTGVTDREIDSLLKIASKEIFRENLNKETIKITDSEALLMSVEEEMGQSFRTKVFEALKESYKTVRTAVADRNN